MLQQFIHYSLHFLFPGVVAYIFFRDKWKFAWLVMAATMLVDLDHLLAVPVYELNRCSINFHPLHSYIAIIGFTMLFFFKKTRILSVGLLLHMATDFLDCLWMGTLPD